MPKVTILVGMRSAVFHGSIQLKPFNPVIPLLGTYLKKPKVLI